MRNSPPLIAVKFPLFLKEFTVYYKITWFLEIRDLQVLKGLALQDILTEVHLFVHRSKFKFLQFILVGEFFHFNTSIYPSQLISLLTSASFCWTKWPT
jgi:hypothetical protein